MENKKLRAFSLALLALGVLLLAGVAVVASRPISSDSEVIRAQEALSYRPTWDELRGSGRTGAIGDRVRAEADLRAAQQMAPIRKEQTIATLMTVSLAAFAVGFLGVFLSNPKSPTKNDKAELAIHAAAKASGKAWGTAETAARSIAQSFAEGRASSGKPRHNDESRT
ncbi:hypothetical protein [Pseudoxanthomonas sp. SGT-18]|uniref:hypothetical protein n=1 Tax=Pseudoxanthomonas sp. SGT-18 TaxID=2493087 RepID=UPI0013DE4FDD|nr:hypothetical protein [Pseudoxanthomonas sp. SGT-18]